MRAAMDGSGHGNAPGGRGRVLLVDDEAAVRRSLQRGLERLGFEVVTAGSVIEACERADEVRPDFAVIDLNLDDGHGFQLIRTIHEINPDCRMVVLTGYDSIASSVRALKAGAVGYLAKPITVEALAEALEGRGREAGPSPMPMSADRVRWEHIQRVFEQCDRNISETARRLNMHRRTLQRILSKRAPR
jgi:two-component system response regulator RegA